ncbi:acyl-CoA dehydrogenase family protein [Streptomyces violaceoruber]|uniref:acyl-CoA dehydrogenase family protein n=1 Tax=Streptomyces violaceoruber TaxID=1935 RepID=UPI003B42B19C
MLRESGLLAVDPDGHRTTHAVTRLVSADDGSVGHLLGYYHLHLWRASLYDNGELARSLRQEVAADQLFVAAVSNPRDALVATETGDAPSISGRGVFATGCAVADRIFVSATRAFSDADAAGLSLTSAERGRAALAVSVAKVMPSHTATETTSHTFELTGARATARPSGLDRFWRDARTLTLHDPWCTGRRSSAGPT